MTLNHFPFLVLLIKEPKEKQMRKEPAKVAKYFLINFLTKQFDIAIWKSAEKWRKVFHVFSLLLVECEEQEDKKNTQGYYHMYNVDGKCGRFLPARNFCFAVVVAPVSLANEK